jgi:hypothetical protein
MVWRHTGSELPHVSNTWQAGMSRRPNSPATASGNWAGSVSVSSSMTATPSSKPGPKWTGTTSAIGIPGWVNGGRLLVTSPSSA